MERKRWKRDIEKVRDGLLDITKELTDKTIPTIIGGVKKIACEFTDSFQKTLQENISKKLESKKSKQEEKKDVNSK